MRRGRLIPPALRLDHTRPPLDRRGGTARPRQSAAATRGDIHARQGRVPVHLRIRVGRATPTRLPTGSATPCSTPSWPPIPMPASPARRWSPPTASSWPARRAGRTPSRRTSLAHLARMAMHDIGYDQDGFSWKHADFECHLHAQSSDIAQGVDAAGNKDEGAGDQGIMFGYACRDDRALMPAPLFYAHQILRRMRELRRMPATSRVARPAAGRQKPGHPALRRRQAGAARPASWSPPSTRTGWSRPRSSELLLADRETQPARAAGCRRRTSSTSTRPASSSSAARTATAGLTGRKIIVDTYGGAAPHGGGAFSGKDPTKVDRSAAYACRYLAKNVVAAGLADRCTSQISYAIGVSQAAVGLCRPARHRP